MDVAEFNDELVDLIAGQSDAQSGHISVREMERIRDDNLIAIIHGLKGNNWGAGQTLALHEQRLESRAQSVANDD
jgi:carnitine 3-dehydrogenase